MTSGKNRINNSNTSGSELHKGYNEKSPFRPQGEFTSDSMQEDGTTTGKKKSVIKIKKRIANRLNKK